MAQDTSFNRMQDEMGRLHYRVPLLLATLAVVGGFFWRAVQFDFIAIDDAINIMNNPGVRAPSWLALHRFWRAPYEHLYIPVTYSFWSLTSWIFRTISPDQGINPSIFHGLNVIVHAINGALVFLILNRLQRFSLGACFVGALAFALHPMQVEPVAWVTGFKDLCGGALGLATLYMAVAFFDGRKPRPARQPLSYTLATVLFCLALLAKPAVAVVPLMALATGMMLERPISHGKRVFAVLPWIVLALVVAWLTARMQTTDEIFVAPWWSRPLIVADSYVHYASKLVWPWPLTVDYGHSAQVVSTSTSAHSIALGVAMLGGMVSIGFLLKSQPLVGWSLVTFLVGLVSTSGLVAFGFQGISTVADRYAYLALVGLSLLMATIGTRSRWWLLAVSALVVVGGSISSTQLGFWKNSKTLFDHALATFERSALVHSSYSSVYMRERDYAMAREHAERALEIADWDAVARYNLGRALLAQGKFDQGVANLTLAHRLEPEGPGLQFAINKGLSALSVPTEMAEEFWRRARGGPPNGEIARDLGSVLLDLGDAKAALPHLRLMAALTPRSANVAANLAEALRRTGLDEEAETVVGKVLEKKPSHGKANCTAALLAAVRHEFSSISEFGDRCLAKYPDNEAVRKLIAKVLPSSASSMQNL